MKSREQELEMLKNLNIILKLLPSTNSIKEISTKTGIPTSTIQRYLNKEELIIELLNTTDDYRNHKEILNEIKTWLEKAKKEGNRRGGIISQEKYGYQKGVAGKFSGNRKSK